MEKNILNIENYRENSFYKIDYFDLNFWKLLQFAIDFFEVKPFDPDGGKAPDTWNPIFTCRCMGYDPYMMHGSDARPLQKTPWTSWPGPNGIERTRLYMDAQYKYIVEPGWYKRLPIPLHTPSGKNEIMRKHFVYTKEIISDNEVVITFCNIATRKYKRVHITDYKVLINSLFTRNKFNNLEHKQPRQFDTKKLKKIVLDGSLIKIQDENIKEILTRLDFMNSKIYEFTSA